MHSDSILWTELFRAKMINAKREKEATSAECDSLYNHWDGQEIAFKQLLDIAERFS